jgi:hypothetical protein
MTIVPIVFGPVARQYNVTGACGGRSCSDCDGMQEKEMGLECVDPLPYIYSCISLDLESFCPLFLQNLFFLFALFLFLFFL